MGVKGGFAIIWSVAKSDAKSVALHGMLRGPRYCTLHCMLQGLLQELLHGLIHCPLLNRLLIQYGCGIAGTTKWPIHQSKIRLQHS